VIFGWLNARARRKFSSTSFRSKAEGRALGWHSLRRKFVDDTKADTDAVFE
jgi:hypothetical protein